MDGSKLLARLQGDLGAPVEKQQDNARWQLSGYEVMLYRTETWEKGADAATVEYEVRARAKPGAAAPSDPNDNDKKTREAEQGSP